MSRKFRRTVASTLALAMMAGTVGVMPELQFSSVVQAADAGATVSVNLTDSSKTTFKPGDTFSVTCDVTDNAEGFSALNAYVTYNKKAFSIEKWEYATTDEDDALHQNINDPTKSNSKYQNPDENLSTLVQLYVDQSAVNLKGDPRVFMAKPLGYLCDRDIHIKQHAGVAVSQIMNPDLLQAGQPRHAFEFMQQGTSLEI